MNRHEQGPIIGPDELTTKYMTSANATESLGVSRQIISALVKNGRLQAVRVHGGRVMVEKNSVAAYQRERARGLSRVLRRKE